MTAHGEPTLTTDERLLPVLDELRQQEPLFHRSELGTRREDLEHIAEAGFWEVGASGRRYSREYVLSASAARYASGEPDEWEASGFHCRELGPETFLLTYTLAQGPRLSRRATIWRRSAPGWQAVYHQGTLVAG